MKTKMVGKILGDQNVCIIIYNGKNLKPDFAVDVSGFMDKKMAAILAYKTQFYDEHSSEPETPISSKNFTDSVAYRARDLGRLIGVEHAEGFTVERCLAVDSIYNLK